MNEKGTLKVNTHKAYVSNFTKLNLTLSLSKWISLSFNKKKESIMHPKFQC